VSIHALISILAHVQRQQRADAHTGRVCTSVGVADVVIVVVVTIDEVETEIGAAAAVVAAKMSATMRRRAVIVVGSSTCSEWLFRSCESGL
jgi:hypothetical protein